MPDMTSSTDPDVESLQLPCAGQTLKEDRMIQIFTFTITKRTTAKDLKAALKDYGLPISGNKTLLTERLRNFANDRDGWAALFQPRVKRKRGDATGANAKLHSAKRIAATYGDSDTPVHFRNRYGDETQAARPISEVTKANNRAWVNEVMDWLSPPEATGLPAAQSGVPDTGTTTEDTTNDSQVIGVPRSQPEAATLAAGVAPAACEMGDSAYLSVSMRRTQRQLNVLTEQLTSTMHRMERKMDQLSMPQQAIFLAAHQAPALVTTAGTAHGFRHPCAVPVANNATADVAAMVPVPMAPAEPQDASLHLTPESFNSQPALNEANDVPHGDQVVVIHLDGVDVVFDKAHIPDPPVMHFSKDITRLFTEWHTSSLLVINGKGIPVKHWPEVYKRKSKAKKQAWEALKVEWGHWKFVVEEKERLGSEEAFWAVHSNPSGKRLRWQQILDRLKQQRQENDARDAGAAKTYFGGDLDHPDAGGIFRYGKKGKTALCTKDSAIAQKWRELLATNSGIRATWDALQGNTQAPSTYSEAPVVQSESGAALPG